jgi:glycosyltransferase involved in cell wall biosynthesis
VHELARRLTDRFHVVAVVPSAPGAAGHETLDGVEVVRYRYAPRGLETLVNDGGIIANLRRSRWKVFLVPTFCFSQLWCTYKLLRKRKVDAMHAHWLIPQGLIAVLAGVLSRRHLPCLVTSHGADLFALRGRVLDSLKRFVVRRMAKVTVVSEAMRSELASIDVDVSKVSVLPMGVDLEGLFTPCAKTLRSKNEILFVGRLVEKKGLRYLIDAMPEIVRNHPAACLTIAGFGPEKEMLMQQVQRLGLQSKVQFIGAVAQRDLPSLYRRAAVFVAPFVRADSGDQEGLGLVVVEAVGCGCPVVVSDLPAVRDVFDTDAPLVQPGSVAEISSKVSDLMAGATEEDELARIRALLVEKFDWSAVATRYAETLNSLIDD